MTLISKTTASLSVLSCLRDMHECGVIYAKNSYAKAAANSLISTQLNSLTTDTLSPKNARQKNWLARHNYFSPINEFMGRVGGYVKGFFTKGVTYIPNFALAAIALFLKTKVTPNAQNPNQNLNKGITKNKIANLAAAGLALIEGFNFTRNAINVNKTNEHLKV